VAPVSQPRLCVAGRSITRDRKGRMNAEMGRLISGPIGFVARVHGTLALNSIHEEIHRVAVEAAKRQFSPEFMNRIDRVLVFRGAGGG
jgi:hypothetical protein